MTWVLLRGLTREARHWAGFVQQLNHALHGSGKAPIRVLALDLPGNGSFNQETSPTSVRTMADCTRTRLQELEVPGPYCLLGMSLGGMVATGWALRHPEDIDRLVLINSSMRPTGSAIERLRPANWFTLAMVATRWRDDHHAEQMIHRLTCNRIDTLTDDVHDWLHLRKTNPVSLRNAWRQLRAAAAFAVTSAPACKVLILSSSNDQLVNPRCSTRLAKAWQARHHMHPWAGHDLPHDDADWVGRRIEEWLAEE